MRVDLFDFELPEERIALAPARPRDAARMLVVRDGAVEDAVVRQLTEHLRPGDALALNVTKVIPARLNGVRPARATGGAVEDVAVEVLLLKREDAARWRAFARPAKRLRATDELRFGAGLTAQVEARLDDGEVLLAFNRQGDTLDQAVCREGAPPLPPYIARRRSVNLQDTEDYQTVYARVEGSVAAPTAGLHFTDALLAAIRAKGVDLVEITLHVGAGTFRPVAADDTKDHAMHAEWAQVTPEAAARLNAARARGGRIVAAGTTSMRVLETAAAAGDGVAAFEGETDIFITPGYRFQAVDVLLTNFHLPRSTLFMLVSAFCGLDVMQRAYAHAIRAQYRFYSYGDACLLYRAASVSSPR